MLFIKTILIVGTLTIGSATLIPRTDAPPESSLNFTINFEVGTGYQRTTSKWKPLKGHSKLHKAKNSLLPLPFNWKESELRTDDAEEYFKFLVYTSAMDNAHLTKTFQCTLEGLQLSPQGYSESYTLTGGEEPKISSGYRHDEARLVCLAEKSYIKSDVLKAQEPYVPEEAR